MIPKLEPIKPPIIDLSLLTDTQWDAHFFLVFREDGINCPRGIRMRLSACHAMQASRTHFLTGHALSHNADYGEDDTIVRADFLVCKNCEHYKPHKHKFMKDGQTAHKKEQDAIIRKLKQAETDEWRRQMNLAAEELRRSSAVRLKATKTKLNADHEARKAARRNQLLEMAAGRDLLIAKAKKMAEKGTSFAMIARALSVGRTTVLRWFMNPERLAQDKKTRNAARELRRQQKANGTA